MTLRRPQGNSRPSIRKIECISRFEGLPAEALYEYVDGHYQYLGTESEIADREAETVILASAPESPEKARTLDELLDSSDAARTTAQRVVKRLVETDIRTDRKRKERESLPILSFEKVSPKRQIYMGRKNPRSRVVMVTEMMLVEHASTSPISASKIRGFWQKRLVSNQRVMSRKALILRGNVRLSLRRATRLVDDLKLARFGRKNRL